MKSTKQLVKVLSGFYVEGDFRKHLDMSSTWYIHRNKLREEAGVEIRGVWFYDPKLVDKYIAGVQARRKGYTKPKAAVKKKKTAARRKRK